MNIIHYLILIVLILFGCTSQTHQNIDEINRLKIKRDSIYSNHTSLTKMYEYVNLKVDEISGRKIDSFMKVNHNIAKFNVYSLLSKSERSIYDKRDSLGLLCKESDSAVAKINREYEELKLKMQH